MNVQSQANETIKSIHVLYPPENVREFYDFLMFLKGNVLEHDMVNDAFEWKFGMSKYVFLKQKYRDFLTKFIVCLPILSQCPLYANIFQGFKWFRLRNSELLKSSSIFWFPQAVFWDALGVCAIIFYFQGFNWFWL